MNDPVIEALAEVNRTLQTLKRVQAECSGDANEFCVHRLLVACQHANEALSAFDAAIETEKLLRKVM